MQVQRAAITTLTSSLNNGNAGNASTPTTSVAGKAPVAAPLTGGPLISGSALPSDTDLTNEANPLAAAAAYARRADPDQEFAARVDRETQEFADSLMETMSGLKIPTDEPVNFFVGSDGEVHADGPYKARIEKMFAENPELAKRLKDIAGLNALVALNKVTRLHNEEMKQAKNDDDREKANNRFSARCVQVEALSGHMTLAGGQLFSAARGFADALELGADA